MVTEGMVTEWCDRLDRLRDRRRRFRGSLSAPLDSLDVQEGTETNGKATGWSGARRRPAKRGMLRLRLRLAENFGSGATANGSDRAETYYPRSATLAPLDVFVLARTGQGLSRKPGCCVCATDDQSRQEDLDEDAFLKWNCREWLRLEGSLLEGRRRRRASS